MKKKRAEKRRHVVAWMNKAEWEQVVDYLHSREPALQTHALHRISAWKGRFGPSTPVAVESTANLVRCQILDRSGKLERDDLVLLYGMALTRFVNLILERKQGRVAKPLRHLASTMNIPEWIVNLRHDITHRRLPTLKWCRKGCEFVLNWLQQQYWSRQLSSLSDWNSSSEEEEDEEESTRRQEEEEMNRQREIERHKRARELLISYEREQFQVFEDLLKRGSARGSWPNASADLSWILAQIQQLNSEARDALINTLVQDGFLIPTAEQLESLNINPSEELLDPLTPCVPVEFLRFWLPLLKVLNSSSFINQLLEKLFAELTNEPTNHRAYYTSAWISEILHCNCRTDESKAFRKMRMMKERWFINRVSLRWHELISACVNAPCAATPFLLQQILMDMDKPLPLDTQHNLLRLCTIYTQSHLGDCAPGNLDSSHPVYTLQNLQERVGGAMQNRHAQSPDDATELAQAPPTQEVQEQLSAETVQERNAALRGSAWSVCTDKVPWKQYPLGKVPGQTDDPSCLMVETYCTLTVFDQQVKGHGHHGNQSVPFQSRTGSDGPLWTHNDITKLKAGLKLF
ncbi:ribosomal biogenesis protein LAS1L isoform X1 [Pangasianodon hypophthalmus]|uniref:ribosomal biogenesis protein LAS1L isoform X1 n=1 Tax=Pangasianodon hypophthalmus TaxID=310915 RepID=UPI002308312D|nr:ribosomal biogenesis protein LAS1L isoform X1 [Pangasianodon hypophthalmus]